MAETMTLEQGMLELEKTVRLLESGELSLEQSMALFEQGVSLLRRCNKLLDETELKVSQLLAGPDGQMAEQPFSAQ